MVVPGFESYLGPARERLVGYGSCAVWRGNDVVAKVGPGAACEAHVLSGRIGSLPISTPALIAEGRDWVVMKEVANDPTPWSEQELMTLLVDLAALHDRFDAIDPALAGPLPFELRHIADRYRVYGRRARVTLPAPLAAVLDDPDSTGRTQRLGPRPSISRPSSAMGRGYCDDLCRDTRASMCINVHSSVTAPGRSR